MIEACNRNGVVLAGIFQFRFKPAWRFVKDAVASGRLGKLVLGDAYNKWWRSQSNTTAQAGVAPGSLTAAAPS